MSVTLCLDANIFLELPEIGVDCEKCDYIFNKPDIKKTTVRIIEEEVDPLFNERIAILSDMNNFYETHKGSQKFYGSRVYFGATIDFKDEILTNIHSFDADFIQSKLRKWIKALISQMKCRKGKLTGPLVPRSTDGSLIAKIIEIPDPDDKEHIVDVSNWANTNSDVYFITLNGVDFLRGVPSLKQKLIDHYHWPNNHSKLDILHARAVS